MKSDVPAVVGVPVIVPSVLSVSPEGRVPAVRVHVREATPAAPMVKEYVPAVVGVPERVPDDAFSVRPEGRSPETWDHVRVSSESAVNFWE